MISGSTFLHAPTLRTGIISPAVPPQTSKLSSCQPAMATLASIRIAVVGDVHDDWNLEEDRKALQLLKPDLVLFTGDFGNENVDLVRSIADLDIAKAVILGNHDAWCTQKFSAREKDAVQLQLECLGDEHVGYRRNDFPMLKLSIVGGRPFSCGGSTFFRKKLLTARYGVHDMDGSAKRIYDAASGTPEDHVVIFLAHNGPTGLGSNMNDICGKDWIYGSGGDHGDLDLAHAIDRIKETTNISIPLVVFGHMHKQLAYGNHRKMIVVGNDGTVYLNGAIVPRVQRIGKEQQMFNNMSLSGIRPITISRSEGSLRAFTVAEIADGKLEKVAETWVSVIGDDVTLEKECTMFSREP